MADPHGGASPAADERRVLEIVDQALELPDEARDAFFSDQCAGNPTLRAAVDALLAACLRVERGEAFLSDSAASYAEPVIRSVEADEGDERAQAPPHVVAFLAGRYEFVREVGRGGNATVYLARDVRHRRDVAIKIIRTSVAALDLRTRFLREITIAAQLQHPYIVSLLDSGEADGTLYYVMPFIDGESLRQRLDREGALPLADAVSIARDIAEALDAAHAMGVVHRDIKPQNVMLRSGHALVADFGIALALEGTADDRLTELGVAVGTPMYMSPEQASASSRIDGRSDVYSLGCVVYEMLAGEAPYPSVTPHAVRSKHLHAPVPDLAILRPAVPPAIPEVLAKALAKVPAERFPSAGAFVSALAEASTRRAALAVGRRRILTGITIVLLAALGLWQLGPRLLPARVAPAPEPTVDADRRRIAVLYFDNLTSDERIGHVADGLTEDLIDALSEVRGLRVISPNGVRAFRDRPPPVDSIARALHVGTVVGGSVSASGNVVRASVRLLDPVTGEQLDTHSIEVPRAEALKLREGVAGQVAIFLRQRLGEEIRLVEHRQETQSLPAWEAARRADALSRAGASASTEFREGDARDLLVRADSLYIAAGRLDPSWTAPTIGRGWVALQLSLVGSSTDATAAGVSGVTPSTASMQRALDFANAALKRPGESAKALALRGYARQWLGTLGRLPAPDSVLRLAEADLRAALDERPDDARSWYALGEVLAADGRFPEAAQALGHAYDGDAYLTESRDVVNLLFFVSLNNEAFDDAHRWCALGQQRYSDGPSFITCPLILLGWTGTRAQDLAQAWDQVAALERGAFAAALASQWAFLRLMAATVAARAGMPDSARAIDRSVHAGLTAMPSRDRALDVDAHVHLLLGDRDEGARVLAQLLRENPQSRGQLERSPWFRDLVADPKYRATLRASFAP